MIELITITATDAGYIVEIHWFMFLVIALVFAS